MTVMVIPIVIDALGMVPNGSLKGLENLEIRGQEETILIKVGYSTEMSPGDFRTLDETQTPVINHPLRLVSKKKKTLKGVK